MILLTGAVDVGAPKTRPPLIGRVPDSTASGVSGAVGRGALGS